MGIALVGFGYFAALTLTGPYGWDDGSITMAFARTLAGYGEFALTAVSERVEGSSTPLFTAILAAIYSFGQFSFEATIQTGQTLTLVCLLIGLCVLSTLMRPKIENAWVRWALLVCFALLPMHLTETLNGMEMTLFGLLLLLFAQCYRTQNGWVYVICVLLLLTRFEASIYLGLALILHALFSATDRRFALRVLGVVIVAFIAISCARYAIFGDLLPNTIRAKMHAPYSMPLDLVPKLLDKSEGLVEFVRVNPGVLADYCCSMGAVPPASVARHKGAVGRRLRFFSLVTGKVWGYEGRMTTAALPLLMWLAVSLWPGKHVILAALARSR